MNLIVAILILSKFLLADGAEWSGNLDSFPQSWGTTKICKDTCQIINDPTAAGTTNKVMKAIYPNGSCSSACGISSGLSFYPKPLPESTKATLEYEVFFPSDFDYVKGGKLPGIVGGSDGCSGCKRTEPLRSECFSARFMWGPNGQGYPYLYLPLKAKHTANFCSLVNEG